MPQKDSSNLGEISAQTVYSQWCACLKDMFFSIVFEIKKKEDDCFLVSVEVLESSC